MFIVCPKRLTRINSVMLGVGLILSLLRKLRQGMCVRSYPPVPGSGDLHLYHTPASCPESVRHREVDILEKAGGCVAKDEVIKPS